MRLLRYELYNQHV